MENERAQIIRNEAIRLVRAMSGLTLGIDDVTVVRMPVTIAETGEVVGSVDLTSGFVDALSYLVSAYIEDGFPESSLRSRKPAVPVQPAVPVAELDSLLVAAIEDHFDSVDPLSYLDDVIAADSPEAAQAAYEQLVTGEWDGEL